MYAITIAGHVMQEKLICNTLYYIINLSAIIQSIAAINNLDEKINFENKYIYLLEWILR